MIDPNEFVQTADLLLNTIVSTYADHGVALPERRYLAVGGIGDTVHDCEQVTVSFEQAYSGTPGNQAMEPAKCDSPRSGVFIVEVVRYIPTVNTVDTAPDTLTPSRYGIVKSGVALLPDDKQSDIARAQMRDAMLLLDAGMRAADNQMAGATVDVAAGSPQGAYQAMIMTVTASAVTNTIEYGL
jgi:hypothetical protein